MNGQLYGILWNSKNINKMMHYHCVLVFSYKPYNSKFPAVSNPRNPQNARNHINHQAFFCFSSTQPLFRGVHYFCKQNTSFNAKRVHRKKSTNERKTGMRRRGGSRSALLVFKRFPRIPQTCSVVCKNPPKNQRVCPKIPQGLGFLYLFASTPKSLRLFMFVNKSPQTTLLLVDCIDKNT